MVDIIFLALLIATTILFIALSLDEVASRTNNRRSNRTSLVPPKDVAAQSPPAPVHADREREAA